MPTQQTHPTYQSQHHTNIAVAELKVYEVMHRNGTTYGRVGIATGFADDIHTFYASKHPGKIELAELDIKHVSHRMASNAVLENIIKCATTEHDIDRTYLV
jgi:hypothetical protein